MENYSNHLGSARLLSALVFCLWLEHDRRQDLSMRSCVSATIFYSIQLYMLILFLWDVD